MARTVHLGACPLWLLVLACVIAALALAASLMACCLCLCLSRGACLPPAHGHAAGQSGGPGDDCCNGGAGDDCGECLAAACLGALVDYW